MSANLVPVSIALLPSPSSLLATLIAATVVAAAIALVVARPVPSSPLPSLLPPSPSPLSSLTTFVAVLIALFIASAFTCLPPLLPLRRLGWGRGRPYRSSALSYFGRHRRCPHHRHCLCRPRDRPEGAGPTTNGIPTPGRQLAPTWWGCCRRSCSRRHPPHGPTGGGSGVPTVAAAAVLATRQQSKRRQRQQHDNNTTTNSTTKKTANTEGG
jgi:hypothetical protein